MIKQLNFFSLMNEVTSKVFYLALLLMSSVFSCFGQDLQHSKEVKADFALREAIYTYDSHLGRNTMVYTGKSYYDANANVKGHQYFEDDYWEIGKIEYDNNVYDSIYLKYDIYRDLVLIENFNSNGLLSPITLFSDKVASFDLMGYHFIWLDRDTLSNIKAGFYNQLYNENGIEVLIKRRKEIVSSNEIHSLMEAYSQKDRYFIKKDAFIYRIRKKKSILNVLSDHKKEVKKFIKSSNFHFKVNVDIQIVEIVKYYDSLRRN